jgi:hypothetical protein
VEDGGGCVINFANRRRFWASLVADRIVATNERP